MKVIHSGTIEVKAGGVATCVYAMLKSLRKAGIDAELFSYSVDSDSRLIGQDVPVHYTKKPIRGKWNKLQYSYSYKKDLSRIADVDIYHANGVWLCDTFCMVDVAKKKKKPYIIMPHGMLYPQDMVKSNYHVKKIFLKLRLLNDLNGASCVLTTCAEEKKHCRALGVTSPIAIIPNSIEFIEYPEKNFSPDRVAIGYIGRVSRRKNIEGLLYAWKNLEKAIVTTNEYEKYKNSKLIIIGDGDKEYMDFLKGEVTKFNIPNVIFKGFLSGELKDKALHEIDILCMPSEFENFGMVITEGLVRGIPCIATKGAPWKDLMEYRCGWWVEYSQESINQAVIDAFRTSAQDLYNMGNNGKNLVKMKYSLDITAAQFQDLYHWILGEAEKPAFVE